MNKYRYLIVLFVVISIFSCKKEGQIGSVKTFDIQFEPKKSRIPHEVLSDVTYVPLETTQESLIGRVDKMIIKDGRIYILDIALKRALYVFDLTGKFLFKIDRKGKGPGEYTDLRDFIVDDNSIIINTFGKVLFFDLNGNYKSFIKSEIIFTNFIFDDFNNAFLFQDCESCNGNKVSKHVLCTNNKFKKIRNEYFEPIRDEPLKLNRFQKLENKILLTAPQYLDNTIYELTSDQCLPRYEFNFGQYNIPVNVINDPKIKFNDPKVHDYAVINYVKENQKYIYFLFTHESWGYAGIISKSANKIHVGFNVDSIPFFNVEIHEMIDNKFYTVIPSYVCSKVKITENKGINNVRLKNILKKSKAIQESTSINDNPIVAVYVMNL